MKALLLAVCPRYRLLISCLALFLFLVVTGCSYQNVRIETVPPAARIIVDGKDAGHSPTIVPLLVDKPACTDAERKHVIEVEKDGYYKESRVLMSNSYYFSNRKPFPELLTIELRQKAASYTTPERPITSPLQPEYFSKVNGQRWAVIIGVSLYQDSRIPRLRYAAADAKGFFNWAVSRDGGGFAPSNVKLLIEEKATGEHIKNALYVWLQQALKEDIVVIYFACHGSPESPDKYDNLFLLPYDADYENVAVSGFPMWDIETALKRFIKAKRVVVIADACHSGGVGQTFDVARRADRGLKVNPISAGLQTLSNIGDGICVISASDEKQFSQESKDWGGGHGVFTYYLIRALKGEADYSKDGKVTLGELIPYLSEQVRRATKNAQCPTVAGKFDPALTIGR